MQSIGDTCARIGPLDVDAMAAAQARQDTLTKPPGSLGQLEWLAIRLAGIAAQPVPAPLARRMVFVLAADHGVVAQGVSAYPAAVTGQMVRNFAAGGAAINALARAMNVELLVADLGVAADVEGVSGLRRVPIAPGTADSSLGPAMSLAQAKRAVETGIALLEGEADRLDVVCTGEMGIGNTTAAAAITAAITGASPEAVTGRGTGLDDDRLRHKRQVVARILAANHPAPDDGLAVLAAAGGFEIGGLAGVILGAAARRIPVLLDGYIATAAALIAATICPAAADYLLAGHRSAELGHAVALAHLGLEPLLDLGMRLGEGTGAVLALPLLDAALAAHSGMATFASAGVAGAE